MVVTLYASLEGCRGKFVTKMRLRDLAQLRELIVGGRATKAFECEAVPPSTVGAFNKSRNSICVRMIRLQSTLDSLSPASYVILYAGSTFRDHPKVNPPPIHDS
jgi:hypothetical protein